jgi:hypothetical protein
MNAKTMMRVRIWAPFLIGFLGGSLAVRLEEPIGEFLGVYNPLTGYLGASMWSGALIALVAALASRTWRGLLTLVLGFATVGLPGGAFGVLYAGVILCLLGVPTYVAVFTVVTVARAPRKPPGPVAGWPPVTPGSIPSETPEDGPPPS